VEGAARHGAAVPRGLNVDLGGDPAHGRFGRMFPRGASHVGVHAIEELVKLMRERTRPSGDNAHIPAGFTYLGQFIDHDITFDPTSKLDRSNDPHALVNFRTPRFDLDSVYGAGPKAQPFLYDWQESKQPGTKLLVGHNAFDATDDLPRNQQGRALIGDARNDENVIVAQLHLLFLRFHNAVVDHLSGLGKVKESELFEAAQRIVRWHYQWIVINEFLPKVVGRTMAKFVLAPAFRREYFTWQDEPFIPVEFSGAAYRFGHSMVRAEYGLQRRRQGEPLGRGIDLFPDLSGFTWLPKRLVIDWERFFKLPGVARAPQPSQRIDTVIVRALFDLPQDGEALPRLNLLRGRALGLASGQEVALAMEEPALSEDELLLDKQLAGDARAALLDATPLWYYILCEAAHAANGRHLGRVGGRIVAEVLTGLLEGDPSSYLSERPTWRPTLGETEGKFEMADLVRIAQSPA
jgi:hypothetical protein